MNCRRCAGGDWHNPASPRVSGGRGRASGAMAGGPVLPWTGSIRGRRLSHEPPPLPHLCTLLGGFSDSLDSHTT